MSLLTIIPQAIVGLVVRIAGKNHSLVTIGWLFRGMSEQQLKVQEE